MGIKFRSQVTSFRIACDNSIKIVRILDEIMNDEFNRVWLKLLNRERMTIINFAGWFYHGLHLRYKLSTFYLIRLLAVSLFETKRLYNSHLK